MSESFENTLVVQIKDGKILAFQFVFERFYKPLCSFAKNFTEDVDIAEDIVQEFFVRFWEKRKTIVINGSLKAYLFQCVRNDCLNFIKQQKVKTKYQDYYKKLHSESFFQDTMEVEELKIQIYNAIDQLPPRCKQIFELNRSCNLTHEQIAEQLKISKNTVKNQIVFALKQIRGQLDKVDFLILFFSFLNTSKSNRLINKRLPVVS